MSYRWVTRVLVIYSEVTLQLQGAAWCDHIVSISPCRDLQTRRLSVVRMFVKSQCKPIRTEARALTGTHFSIVTSWFGSCQPHHPPPLPRHPAQSDPFFACGVLSSPSLPQLVPNSKPTEREAQVITGALGLHQVKSHYKSPWEALKSFPRTRMLLSEMLLELGVFSSHRSRSYRNWHTALFNYSIFMGAR